MLIVNKKNIKIKEIIDLKKAAELRCELVNKSHY